MAVNLRLFSIYARQSSSIKALLDRSTAVYTAGYMVDGMVSLY